MRVMSKSFFCFPGTAISTIKFSLVSRIFTAGMVVLVVEDSLSSSLFQLSLVIKLLKNPGKLAAGFPFLLISNIGTSFLNDE